MRHTQAIVTFMGFKNSDRNRCGFEDGYFEYVSHYAGGDTLTFAPRTWKTNVENLADQLRRQGVRRVAMLSYSHGQAAATSFARYAYEIGLNVDLWIACDPVYRPTWLPRWTVSQWLAWKALLKKGKIKVPRNIARTVYIRQEKDKPRGHTLVPTSSSQYVECKGILHSVGHTEIDESPEYWAMVDEELEAWTNPKKAVTIS